MNLGYLYASFYCFLICTLAPYIVCVIFYGGIIYVLGKRAQKDFEEKLKNVTQEQKDILINTQYQVALNCPNGVIVCGMIYEMKKKLLGGFSLYVIYYNTYFPNFKKQISYMNVSVSAKIAEENNLKNGDFIKILLNEDKSPKIVCN